MGVSIKRAALRGALERAVRRADRNDEIAEDWLRRTAHIGDSPSQTMIAVLGNAMLARAAAGASIDPRSIKSRSGARGFSARGTVTVLVAGARDFGYDLGVSKAEPLNNQPWFHAERVDRIALEEVRGAARPYLRALKGYLKEMDSLSADEAERALAAFIVSRREVADQKREATTVSLHDGSTTLPLLADAVQSFALENPESGRRGQALAAAALDCVFSRVELGQIHDPDAFDILVFRKRSDERPSPVVQVKQKPVGEDAVINLAEAASEQGVNAALLIALSKDQRSFDEQAIEELGRQLGVVVRTITTVPQLMSSLAVFASRSPLDIADRFPRAFAKRLREIGATESAISHWRELVDEVGQVD